MHSSPAHQKPGQSLLLAEQPEQQVFQATHLEGSPESINHMGISRLGLYPARVRQTFRVYLSGCHDDIHQVGGQLELTITQLVKQVLSKVAQSHQFGRI